MRIRPGTVVMFLCFALVVYALIAMLAIHAVTRLTSCTMGAGPRVVKPPMSNRQVAGIAIAGVGGYIGQFVAGIYVRRHRRNRAHRGRERQKAASRLERGQEPPNAEVLQAAAVAG